MATLRHYLRWLFTDRRSGRIVVAQAPNALLWLVIAAWLLGALIDPSSAIGRILGWTGHIALALWALDEIARGVNPWRRCLGAIVLVYVAITVSR